MGDLRRPAALDAPARLGFRVGRSGPVAHLRAVLDAYGAAGGGLLASGLAFGALFALVPITLLVVGIAGFFVGDAAVRAAVLREIADRVPALREVLGLAVDELSGGAAGLSAVALVALGWTATQFYGQLDGAFARVFEGEQRRGLVARTVRGVVTIVIALAIFLLMTAASVLTTADLPFPDLLGPVVRLASPIVAVLFAVGAVAAVYRLVPSRRVPWPALLLPAAVVGGVEMALSTAFVALAPHLASPRLFGPFVAIFATLAWLSWAFQVLLIGAAWVRERAFGVRAVGPS